MEKTSEEKDGKDELTDECIDELQLFEAVDLCRKLEIDSSGCTSLNDVKAVLKDYMAKMRSQDDLVPLIQEQNDGLNIGISESQASPQETSASGLETETPPVSLSQNLSGDPNPLLECDTSMLFGSDEVSESLDKDLGKQKEMKKHLMEIYDNTSSLFDPETILDGLREIIVETKMNYREKIITNRSKLVSEECPIVVAGETSAGKSTLINLLIGDELLPYSVLHKTAAICCLRHSEEKRLVYEVSGALHEDHFENNIATEVVNDKIDKLMEDPDVKLINIYWPIPILKKQVNVTLIDTPGLGDNEDMVDMLLKYLPNAVGFIYAINSANAGGIEKNKILRILSKQVSLEREGENVFDITSTIFVCNKWDQVPEKEDDKVMGFIQNKLQECMAMANKEIDMDKQVLRLSGSQALLAMRNHKTQTTDFETPLRTINVLVPKCLERKYVQLYSWMRQSVLEKICQTASTHLLYAWTPVEERRKLQADVDKRLLKLSKRCAEVHDKMQKEGNNFCIGIAKKLHKHLHSKEVIQRLSHWEQSETPYSQSDKLVETIESAVMERIKTEIVYWQTNERDFQNDLRTFKANCTQMCESLEKDIEAVNLMIEGAGHVVDLPQKHGSVEDDSVLDILFGHVGVGAKVAAVVTVPLWVPVFLVVGMLGLPFMGIGSLIKGFVKDAKDALESKTLRKEYENDKPKFIENFTKAYLKENITLEYIRKFIIKTYYGDYIDLIDYWYNNYIPEQLAENQMFLKCIVNERDTSSHVQTKYRPVQFLLRSFLSQMTHFRLKFLEEPCINEKSVDIMGTIWSGAKTQIQEIQYRAGESTWKAAMKTFSLRDSQKLQEAECLLALNHLNITRTFGVVHADTQAAIDNRCSIIMELCQGNAETLFLQDLGNACGKIADSKSSQGREAYRRFISFCVGTCSALKYIHESGYLHGNLKLSKILVSGKLQPKLTGLGSIQFESASSCKTMSGLSHFAPEVFSRRPYRWSSDVYSFGIACWEMWFGRKAFLEDDLKTHSPIEFASKLFAGYRPTIEDSFRKPPDKLWKEMQCCLECQFEKRPNIEKVESTLHGMSH